MRKQEWREKAERLEGDSEYWQKMYGLRKDEAYGRKEEADRLKAQVKDLAKQKECLLRDVREAEDAIDFTKTLQPYPDSAPRCQKCGSWMNPRLIDRTCYTPEHLVWTCACGYTIKTKTKDDTNA